MLKRGFAIHILFVPNYILGLVVALERSFPNWDNTIGYKEEKEN